MSGKRAAKTKQTPFVLPSPFPKYVLDEGDVVHCRSTQRRARCGRVLKGIWWSEDWLPFNYPYCPCVFAKSFIEVHAGKTSARGARPRTVSGGLPGLGRRR
jgi:hypothetical protein